MMMCRIPIGRAHAGGLSLLVAVALLSAAGSGVDTARRVASTGAVLALAMVQEPAALHREGAARRPTVLSGIAARLGAGSCVGESGKRLRPVACDPSTGLIDLPPPSAIG
ncbi:MAG: hypothetical protein AAFR96_09650 [Planctomycetota bacterium]